MTAFDPATEAWLAPRTRRAQRIAEASPSLDWKAIDSFIASRKHNRFFRTPRTLAEDLKREGLWPNCTTLEVAARIGFKAPSQCWLDAMEDE